jgi:hypothetical protein
MSMASAMGKNKLSDPAPAGRHTDFLCRPQEELRYGADQELTPYRYGLMTLLVNEYED